MCLTWRRNWVETKIPGKRAVEVEKPSFPRLSAQHKGAQKGTTAYSLAMQPSSGMKTALRSARAGGIDFPIVLKHSRGGWRSREAGMWLQLIAHFPRFLAELVFAGKRQICQTQAV